MDNTIECQQENLSIASELGCSHDALAKFLCIAFYLCENKLSQNSLDSRYKKNATNEQCIFSWFF